MRNIDHPEQLMCVALGSMKIVNEMGHLITHMDPTIECNLRHWFTLHLKDLHIVTKEYAETNNDTERFAAMVPAAPANPKGCTCGLHTQEENW